ncbi:hypothetical protein OV208_17795 [Corallococcus sp. bb12-1]|uniref:hypothetical protein n=1 Tax=Corallococcus sp. bb12-1 TaxID=2996784 RepID=UPI0022701475|nr:hypothetical protein [Corallococcus sp. bb12-1]MCY1043175.1 hypothetical protein [Corallococcus sp. bb12-1]
MRKTLIAGLMAVGMLAGCGGAEDFDGEAADLSTREDGLVRCPGNQASSITYYSGPDLRTIVGGYGCSCTTGASSFGRRSDYVVERIGAVCTAS